MFRLLAFGLLFAFYSCSSNQNKKDEGVEIVVRHAHSYEYDLTKQTYTVFTRHGDTTIHFTLADNERKQIVYHYYNLRLDEISGKRSIEDNCEMMPKRYSVLKVKSKRQTQAIAIDEYCGDYKGLFDTRGKGVSAFLQFIREILHKKPEIKNAPKSDIGYM